MKIEERNSHYIPLLSSCTRHSLFEQILMSNIIEKRAKIVPEGREGFSSNCVLIIIFVSLTLRCLSYSFEHCYRYPIPFNFITRSPTGIGKINFVVLKLISGSKQHITISEDDQSLLSLS